MPIQAYAVHAPDKPLVAFSYEPPALGVDDVEVRVEYCGICYSDIAMARNLWGFSEYPLVPGHEAVGIVEKTGSQVSHLKKGDRVGIGWQADSCGHCEWCRSGDEPYCGSNVGTIVRGQGGFAEAVRLNSRFAIPIPKEFPAEYAGPMMCGGITVFSPFVAFNIRPGMKVGVIGIGGLGHIALQFAKAWGCEVTAFSTSPAKEDEAKSHGAHHFVNSKDPEALERLAGSFDLLLNTVHASLDWLAYALTLRPKGTLCFLGVPGDNLNMPVFPLVAGERRIAGSSIGSPLRLEKMMEFALLHDVKPQIERFPLAKVNEAFEHLLANKARYRIVLDVNP